MMSMTPMERGWSKNPYGLQQNPKRIPGPKINPPIFLKIKFGCTLFAVLLDRDTQALPQIFRLFWIPLKDRYLNQATPKKYLPKFPTPKYPGIENFNPQKSFDHACHLKSGESPWGMTPGYFHRKQNQEKTKRTFYNVRKQPTFDLFPAKWCLRNERRNSTWYWWCVTTQISLMLLIGRAAKKIWFNQSEALPRSG